MPKEEPNLWSPVKYSIDERKKMKRDSVVSFANDDIGESSEVASPYRVSSADVIPEDSPMPRMNHGLMKQMTMVQRKDTSPLLRRKSGLVGGL